VTGTPPFQYVWRFNGDTIPGATNAALIVPAVQNGNGGQYSVYVFNGAGAVESASATLVILTPVYFTLEPVNHTADPGEDVTLTSAAVGSGTVRYQWRFEAAEIPGATNASYTITNASFANHGNYSVVAIDDISSVVSSNAFVFMLVRPTILVAPLPQTVLEGGVATFSCVATGAPPLFYRWLSNNAQFVVTTVPYLSLTNSPLRVPPATFRVIVTNLAGSTISLNSTNVRLTVLADFDRDGAGDAWEAQHGFSTNSAADAILDPDGDGMINRSEYVAGTNPADSLSVLKVVLSATNATELNFTAQSNISYTVQWQTNIAGTAWQNLTNIIAEPAVRTITLDMSLAPASADRYFRVVTPAEPGFTP
jgi:hypothetical protein